jgi:hypothetical protein
MHETDLLAAEFERHRAHLRAVVYRMLGSGCGGRGRRPGILATSDIDGAADLNLLRALRHR